MDEAGSKEKGKQGNDKKEQTKEGETKEQIKGKLVHMSTGRMPHPVNLIASGCFFQLLFIFYLLTLNFLLILILKCVLTS